MVQSNCSNYEKNQQNNVPFSFFVKVIQFGYSIVVHRCCRQYSKNHEIKYCLKFYTRIYQYAQQVEKPFKTHLDQRGGGYRSVNLALFKDFGVFLNMSVKQTMCTSRACKVDSPNIFRECLFEVFVLRTCHLWQCRSLDSYRTLVRHDI